MQGGVGTRQERRIRAWNENPRGQVYQHVECGVDHGRLVARSVQLGRKVSVESLGSVGRCTRLRPNLIFV